MTTSTNNPPLRAGLQTAEAARYLGVSRSLLRKWRLKGTDDPGEKGPPYCRITRQLVVYQVADLDAWLWQHRQVA